MPTYRALADVAVGGQTIAAGDTFDHEQAGKDAVAFGLVELADDEPEPVAAPKPTSKPRTKRTVK